MAFGFKDIPINFLLAGLFLLSMIGFITALAYESGVSSPLDGNTIINTTALNATLSRADTEGKAHLNASQEDAPTSEFGQFISFAIIGNMWAYASSAFEVMNIFADSSTKVGISPLTVGIIDAILLIVVIFAAWRVIRIGE